MPSIMHILQLSNGKYYIGSTDNYLRRLEEHILGLSPYTRRHLPIKPVFHQQYTSIKLARKVEMWLKRQKDKNLIIRIINDGKISKTFE